MRLLLAILLSTSFYAAAEDVNCDPEAGMVDIEHCTEPEQPLAPGAPTPWDDKLITCEEMKAHPDQVFTGSIDLGSGHGSPIEVDYRCKESLASLPFLQTLHRLTERIRSDRGPQRCTGSIIHAYWRYYHFSLLEAGFAPRLLRRRHAEEQRLAPIYPHVVDQNRSEYFERWSYESLYNYDLYTVYMAELERARPLLARHYAQTFGFSASESAELAGLALRIFVTRAAGTFPREGSSETARVLDAARLASLPLVDLEHELDNHHADHASTALNIALLRQLPRTHIRTLVDRLESLDVGMESALFFALRDRSNVEYLLERGANINYQNPFGKTALFYAIGFNDHALVKTLLVRGAAVNHAYKGPREDGAECAFQIRSGRTPLMHAAQHADAAMLKLLIEHRAHIGAVDEAGENALVYALRADKAENASYLRSVGLEAARVEAELARSRKFRECLTTGEKKQLKGPELSAFLRECWK